MKLTLPGYRRFFSSNIKFSARIPFGSSAKEQPTPLVFVAGEGLSSNVWHHSIAHFSAKGYHGLAVELPYCSPAGDLSLDGLVEHLQALIRAEGDLPPVLVAHSLSSFVAQKLLESYPLTGLIMVNPVPVDPKDVVARQLKDWNSAAFTHPSSREAQLRAYYGLDPSQLTPPPILSPSQSSGAKWRPFSGSLASYLVTNPEAQVQLEPFSVPMGVIVSRRDRDEYLGREGIAVLLEDHSIDHDSCIIMGKDKSRASMLSGDAAEFNKIISEWLDLYV